MHCDKLASLPCKRYNEEWIIFFNLKAKTKQKISSYQYKEWEVTMETDRVSY